ncbi:MAG: restriction endonuclease subunit S [Nitrososphaera sp.]
MNSQAIPSLPKGWVLADVGSVCSIASGAGFPLEYQGRRKGQIPFFKVGDISEAVLNGKRYLTQAANYVSKDDCKSLNAKPLKKGAIVFAKIGAAIALNRRAILAQESLVDNNIMGLECFDLSIDNLFAYYFMLTVRLGQYSRATTVPSLRRDDVASIPFPMPPLNEQRRIVAKIEELFSDSKTARDALDNVPGIMKRIRQSVLVSAFRGQLVPQSPNDVPAEIMLNRTTRAHHLTTTIKHNSDGRNVGKSACYDAKKVEASGLSKLPLGWVWTTFEELCRDITVGHVGPMMKEYVENGIPFLRSLNVRENYFDPTDLKFISESFHNKLSKSKLEPGNIVVVRSGNVGISCVIPGTLKDANCSDLIIMRPLSCLLSEYGSFYINSAYARDQINFGKVGIAQTHFNIGSMRKLVVPIPPFEEQKRIVAKVKVILNFAEDIERSVTEVRRRAYSIDGSILTKAFSGKLVAQDPNDEPASLLLERIKKRDGI